jgi:hypothetical protein
MNPSFRLFCDRRLKPDRYYVAETEETMFIPQEVLHSVAFIYARINGKKKPLGTVFFVFIRDQGKEMSGTPYAITARHVLEKIQRDSDDDKVYFRLNLKGGNTRFVETRLQDWLFHPSDNSVDVAVLPWLPSMKTYDVKVIRDAIFVTDAIVHTDSIGIGDEVFIAGLFSERLGEGRNIPIVRIGNIAAAGEPFARQEQ